MGSALTTLLDRSYARLIRPLLFAQHPDGAHATTIRALAALDALPLVTRALSAAFTGEPVSVGGVTLPSPVMVAAGLVKGRGFDDEARALAAAKTSNIIPGWRAVPAMCGSVEFGSYTRFPRVGNAGRVMWRDPSTRSTQNRVGLRNPGARAAAAFLAKRKVPGVYGISVATTPGQGDPAVQAQHIAESIGQFRDAEVRPAWYTVNLSCPNTEDDPHAGQTADLADAVCEAAVRAAGSVPVWAKVGPDLANSQYDALVDAFSRTGIRAVVATNTLSMPVAHEPYTAGLAGGRLFEQALSVVLKLYALRDRRGGDFDLVGCGGIMDGNGVRAYTDAGAKAVQIWSALVYRGPFAPLHIAREYAALLEAHR